MDTISDGYVLLSRKLLDNPIFKDREALQLFLYGLLRANHKPNRIIFNRQEMALDRGQFITGIYELSRATGQTPKQIRTRLALLENTGIWARRRASKFSIITICNYDYYQTPENYKGQAKGQGEGKQRATDNNVNNGRSNIGRSKKETDPRVNELLSYWREAFQKETGQPYHFVFVKDGKLVKDLLITHPIETLQEIIRAFFRDEQCKRRGLTIGIFSQEINRLIGLKAMNPLEQAKREKGFLE